MTNSVTCPCSCHQDRKTIYCSNCAEKNHPKEFKRMQNIINGKICYHDKAKIEGYTCNKCLSQKIDENNNRLLLELKLK